MRHVMSTRRQRGFNLMEIMIALAIASILAVAGTPYLADYVNRSRLRETGNTLLAIAIYAQSEAANRGGGIVLTINANSVVVTDNNPPVPVQLRNMPLANLSTVIGAPFVIALDSTGRPNPPATFKIETGITGGAPACSGDMQCPALRIEAGGALSLCRNKQDLVACPNV